MKRHVVTRCAFQFALASAALLGSGTTQAQEALDWESSRFFQYNLQPPTIAIDATGHRVVTVLFSVTNPENGQQPWDIKTAPEFKQPAGASRLSVNFGWTTAIIGEESGGRVDNLPLHYFQTEVGTQAIKCPTETKISDPRWAEMADQGFIPLVYKDNSNFATFYTAPSCQRPAVYDKSTANANARLSASLPYIFAASRFAHYLKVINRTKLGTFATRKNLEDYLNRWILNYVVGNEDASQELKSTYPLQEARVDVESVEGKPGWYRAVAYLKPHMHLEAVTTSLRLVADLPQKKQ